METDDVSDSPAADAAVAVEAEAEEAEAGDAAAVEGEGEPEAEEEEAEAEEEAEGATNDAEAAAPASPEAVPAADANAGDAAPEKPAAPTADDVSEGDSDDSLDEVISQLKARVDSRNTELSRLKRNVHNKDPDRRTVYVGQLDLSTLPEELYFDLFCDCGEINRVAIHTDPNSGLPCGFAYVEFAVCTLLPLKTP